MHAMRVAALSKRLRRLRAGGKGDACVVLKGEKFPVASRAKTEGAP